MQNVAVRRLGDWVEAGADPGLPLFPEKLAAHTLHNRETARSPGETQPADTAQGSAREKFPRSP